MAAPITMNHRTAAVLLLSVISMMGCFLWWGRLSLNNGSISFLQRHDAVTPPPFLFQSTWTADDDEYTGDDDNYKWGERIRDAEKLKKQKQMQKPSNSSSARSIDGSLETASDSETNVFSWEDANNRPKMVWLMSYPNSGTSYTMMMVARATHRATASNYGKEVQTAPKIPNTPLYPGEWNGPFYKPDPRKQLPQDYILVKTHCGGRCVTCGPDQYVLNETEFLGECTRGSGLFPPGRRLQKDIDGSTDEENESGDLPFGFQTVHYDPDLVKKAIHLYRNPFHNIVSRFHLERKHWVQSNKKYEVKRYPNDATGFQKWCKDLNKVYGPSKPSKRGILKADIVEMMQDVPCHGEMYKYVQWHNMANAVVTHANKPTLIVHYENYNKKWNQTAATILDFLHLEFEGEKREFSARHDYDPYFTDSQRVATKVLFERLASEPVWKQVERYFR